MDDASDRLLRTAYDQARAYLDGTARRRVVPDEAAIAALDAFDEPLPASGIDGAEVLDRLARLGAPATVAQGGGRYFGFVNGGLLAPALAARWLADSWDQNAALQVMSPISAKLEAVCERWLIELLGLPAGSAAGLVSGTSTSLLCGFAAARDALLARHGWNVAAEGLFGAPEMRVVVGEQAHGSVFKALSLVGLGRERVERVPCDQEGRMRADALPPLDDRTLLVLAAGNVNGGAFDPMRPLCERARAAKAWVHVDGAFGLWAAACPGTVALCDGIALADSWSVDAHKTLNAPYDCGLILCRDAAALRAAMQADGAYLQWSDARDGMATTPEMSRRARGVELWATLAVLGREGVASLVAQLCHRARLFATLLREADFRVLNEVVFNQVLVAADTPEQTRETLAAIQAGRECWCGGSQWRGEPVIRISVCSAQTSEDDVRRTVAAFVAAREACT